MTQIKELYTMIKEEFHNSSSLLAGNYKLSVLLMQAGHFRDILLRLIQNNVKDDNSYDWQKEIRCYYNGNDIAHTKYLTKTVDYGY